MAAFRFGVGGTQKALIFAVPDAIFPKPSRLLSGMETILAKFYQRRVTGACAGGAAAQLRARF